MPFLSPDNERGEHAGEEWRGEPLTEKWCPAGGTACASAGTASSVLVIGWIGVGVEVEVMRMERVEKQMVFL